MKCYIKVPIPRFPENGVISPSPSAPCARSMFGTSRFTHFAAARFIFSLKLSRSAMGVPRLRPEERQRMQRHGDDPGYSWVKHGETDHFFNKVGLFISLHTLHIVIFHFRANKVTPYIRDAIALAELINICNVCACVYINVSCVYINHHFALLCQLQPSQQPAPPPRLNRWLNRQTQLTISTARAGQQGLRRLAASRHGIIPAEAFTGIPPTASGFINGNGNLKNYILSW